MNSLRKIVIIWALITLALCVGFFLYLGTFPESELSFANSLDYRIIMSLLIVGTLSAIGLFGFLFFGSILRDLFRSRKFPKADSSHADSSL